MIFLDPIGTKFWHAAISPMVPKFKCSKFISFGPKNDAKFWTLGGLTVVEGLMAQKLVLLAIRPNRSEIVIIAYWTHVQIFNLSTIFGPIPSSQLLHQFFDRFVAIRNTKITFFGHTLRPIYRLVPNALRTKIS